MLFRDLHDPHAQPEEEQAQDADQENSRRQRRAVADVEVLEGVV